MRRLSIIIATLLGLVVFESQSAVNRGILVDNSGSVAGFYNTGSMERLVRRLTQSIGEEHKICLFNEVEPLPINGVDDPTFACSDNDTLINKAFLKISQQDNPDIVWLITDNIEDDPRTVEVDGNTEDFYLTLQNEKVKRILLFPCFLRFNGPVFINKETGEVEKRYYQGRKGLLIYAILLNSDYEQLFDQEADKFKTNTQTFDSTKLLGKPLDENTFELILPEDLKSQEIYSENNEAANIYFDRKIGILQGKGFKEGQKLRGIFYVKFQSKFQNLQVVKADLDITPVGEFQVEGFKEAQVHCDIQPRVLEEVGPGQISSISHKVIVDCSTVTLKRSLGAIWKSIFDADGKGNVTGILKVQASVPNESFKFTETILNKYDTEDIENQAKIYKMGALIKKMSRPTTLIPIQYDLSLEVSYPKWPLLFLLLPALFVALVYFAARRLRWKYYAVSVNHGPEENFTLLPIIGRHPIKVDNTIIARITKALLSIKVRSTAGFKVNGGSTTKRLDKSGDFFSLQNDEGQQVNVEFKVLSTPPTKTKSEPHVFDLPTDKIPVGNESSLPSDSQGGKIDLDKLK